MSTLRLTFLYPHLFRSQLPRDGRRVLQPLSKSPAREGRRCLHSSGRRQVTLQRYGPAAGEPALPPQLPKGQESVKPSVPAKADSPPASSEPSERRAAPPPRSEGGREDAPAPDRDAPSGPELGEDSKSPSVSTLEPSDDSGRIDHSLPKLDRVLHMAAPSGTSSTSAATSATTPSTAPASELRPPHLEPGPYVHHFDTYSLVKDLEKGGFTLDQSVTIMKGVRSLLADNLSLAQAGLVSKSDVENEAYLFRAACSELRTEILSSRRTTADSQRAERARLQADLDAAQQRVSHESQTLKDEMRGKFDDRKMAVQSEMRSMDAAIQELNYKITVRLGSDSKGQIEGLRWFLTRRAVIFISSMALLILTSIRYTAYQTHVQEQERKKMAGSSESSSSGTEAKMFTTPSRSTGTQTRDAEADAVMKSINAGTGPSFVSLG